MSEELSKLRAAAQVAFLFLTEIKHDGGLLVQRDEKGGYTLALKSVPSEPVPSEVAKALDLIIPSRGEQTDNSLGYQKHALTRIFEEGPEGQAALVAGAEFLAKAGFGFRDGFLPSKILDVDKAVEELQEQQAPHLAGHAQSHLTPAEV